MKWLFACTVVVLIASGLVAGWRRRPLPAARGRQIHPPPDWAAFKGTLTVGTFNIHRGCGTDGVRDLGRISGLLGGCDVIALQEVAGSALPGGRDQVEQLAGRTGLGWLFVPVQSRWFREYFGNGLLSRFPVHSWTREPLVDTTGKSQRALFRGNLRLGDRDVTLLIAHLDRGSDRNAQLDRVLQVFLAEECALLLGDLNTLADDERLREVIDSGEAQDAIGDALGPADPTRRVDWILTRGLQLVEGAMEPVGASDHPLFRVELGLEARDGGE